ncbi:S8 family serine peptidase [Thermococcus sibiricus]|uniref:Pyrolisin-like serine protease n=1 Tax=Thermococcus sibiricus (strain DSM 12597 / MM 739) TaxID=604354 RepID=C6A139_THESM|nr:S8 family serine peptidase [Thermococcus sibiricus]ACS89334.1 pyrolisin-like serine protease [Thermococcus sibiricus MM 739]
MDRRTLSLLIVILVVLSAIPTAIGSAKTSQISYKVTKIVPANNNQETSTDPLEKIDPKLLEILDGKETQGVLELNNQKIILLHIITTKEISSRILGAEILGKTKVLNNYIYIVKVPLKRDSKITLRKIASLPEVEAITRMNPVEPVEINKNEENSLAFMELPQSKFAERVKTLRPKESLSEKRVLSFKDVLSGELKKLRENSPASTGEAKLAFSRTNVKVPSQPTDYFAIYHHGSWNTWFDLGITGEGVNVAVIDSGVDFGNPDLQDAYAVDTNLNSPYYGWPIAFDGNSMLYYLLFGATFLDFATFSGYLYSWYANTEYPIEPYPVYGYFGIGYKGNYTTVFTSMSLANIPDDYERSQLINNTLKWVGNVTNILLVDDDGGDLLELFYIEALDYLGVNYTYYEIPDETANGPNVTVLSNYSLVIWFTGATYTNTLTNADIGNLTQYLENGGKLWLISSDYLYDVGLDNNFTTNYLHIADAIEDYPVPTVIYDYNGDAYYGGEVYQGLWESPTDIAADYIVPDANATILLTGYTVYAYDPQLYGYYVDIKLPLTKDLTIPTQSGTMKLGLHPDLALWYDWYGGFVLVTDPNANQTYDTVYVDLTPSVVIDFNKDTGHTKDNPVVQLDFWDTFENWFGQDGYADLSGGLIYFIADGETPIPYSDKVAERWGLPLRIPGNGDLVAFMIGNVYIGGGDHGTLCAAAVGARGRTFLGLTFGNAIGTKIIAEGSLYQGGSWLDYLYFAVEGYDGIVATGDEALVVSNSYSVSSDIQKGFSWYERFLYYMTEMYAPNTAFLFAMGNGGPGYGTTHRYASSPAVIGVGAAVEFGYRALFGYDNGPWGYELANYGDVVWFSDRGPNALGRVKPDVIAVGAYALGSLPVNYVGDGFWAADLWSGTSLATPMAAGIAALVYEAFYESHGRWPTAHEVKEILMSTAKNVNHDVFSQGAGFLDAYRAVKLAMNQEGIKVSPSSWQAGKTNYPMFANVLYPGESASKTFTVENINPNENVTVEISAEIFQKIGEVELDVVGNSFAYYSIGSLIPNGTELMKVTLYTSYQYFDPNMDYSSDAYPWFRIFDVTYVDGTPTLNLLQQGLNEGTTTWAAVGNPLEKMHDDLWVQIRDLWRSYTYPAKLKLEFYKRVPWTWIKLDKNTLTVEPNQKATFKATASVPSDAEFGTYGGAIYLRYNDHETVIPISITVASPTPNFTFGGNSNATGLYDNSNVYGTFDWGWRYESGDWRVFHFNIPESEEGSYVLVDLDWENEMTDINLHLLGPILDEWSTTYPDIFGPYTLKEIGGSDDAYVSAGLFLYQTTSGDTEELIGAKAINGLNAILLHNVLLNGTKNYETFSGKVGLAKIYPERWVATLDSQTGENTFIVELPACAGNITATAFGFSTPRAYSNVIAPSTGDSHYYAVNVATSPILDVELNSVWDELAGLDLDLYVYYNESGTLIEVGSSTTATSDETVTLDFPTPGQYVIEVYSWSNPAPGSATYDLKITTIDGTELQVKNITEFNGTYTITAAYNLTEEHMNATLPLNGIILIGTNKNPLLFQVPVVLTPSPYDVKIAGVETSGVPYVDGIYNVTIYVTNEGLSNATDVEVRVVRDNVPTDIQVSIPTIAPGEIYNVTFSIPMMDSLLHEYKFVVNAPYDMNIENNEELVYAQAYEETTFGNELKSKKALFSESIGFAEIVQVNTVGGKKVETTLEGENGAIVTVFIDIPKDRPGYYLRISGGQELSRTLIELPETRALKVQVQITSPANRTQILVLYSLTGQELILQLNYFYYVSYRAQVFKFNKLYNEALDLGVSNDTLQQALTLNQTAARYYNSAIEMSDYHIPPYLGDMRLIVPLRNAYLNIRNAIKVLEKAIEEIEGS